MSSSHLKNKMFFSMITVVIIGVSISCENPFSNNLGEKVDVEWPTITVMSPEPAAILKEKIEFKGMATAYREVRNVEVRILDIETNNWLPWMRVQDVKGESTEKKWTYILDTLDFEGRKMPDGFLKVQFRSSDPNLTIQDKNLTTLVYIIKNLPSEIKMSAPSDERLAAGTANRETKKEIRGQIIDRRGIKPGFPRIKMWPADEPEPAGDDPAGGWVTVFLSDVDDTSDVDVSGNIKNWSYADRSRRTVENVANFVFKLAKFDIEEETIGGFTIKKAVYKTSGGDFEGLPIGKYKLRIWTSETYFDENFEVINSEGKRILNPSYRFPRQPIGAETEIVGYKPDIDESYTDPQDKGPFWLIDVRSTGVDPDIALDNSDKDPLELTRTPNIYITDSTTKKILTGNPARHAFRLRIHAYHPELIDYATLEWNQPGSGRPGGTLIWDNISGNEFESDVTKHQGALKDPSNPGAGKNFVFTATGGTTDTNGDVVFISGTRPYMLEATVYSHGASDDDRRSTRQRYTVYVSDYKPIVRIESVKGAAAEQPLTTPSGSTLYTVNGNIEITIDAIANMGMHTENGRDLVKWFVEKEEDFTDYENASGTVKHKIETYQSAPGADNLQFFNVIVDSAAATAASGWVGGNSKFKFNTSPYDGKDLWLYVIAQDTVQGLGYTRVKLHVDESTDIPTLEAPGMTAVGAGVNSRNDLFIEINAGQAPVDSTKVRRNVIDRDTGIDLTFTDDDGINLNAGGITIKLTDLNNANASTNNVTLTTAQVQSILSGSGREWSGMLSQKIMAEAMKNNPDTNNDNNQLSYLRDGIYQLDITYEDDVTEKVSITGTTVASVSRTVRFYFCMMSGQPTITIDKPVKGIYITEDPEEITGKVTSYIPVQRIWISFEPALTYTGSAGGWKPLPLYTNPGYTTASVWNNQTPNALGEYVYYWHETGVLFGTGGPGEDRNFTIETADNLGNFLTEPWAVKLDKEPPKVNLEEFYFGRSPETYKVNGKFNFVISAQDNNGIKLDETGDPLVKWWIVPSAGAVPNWNTTLAAAGASSAPNGMSGQFTTADDKGGARYEGKINSGNINGDTLTQVLANGMYKLYAAAEDRAGNRSAITLLKPFEQETFEIDQSADYPELDMEKLDPNGANVIKQSAGLKITGKVIDDDGFTDANVSRVQIRFPTSQAHTGWETTWRNVSAAIDPTGALEFEYEIPDSLKTVNAYFAPDNNGEKRYQIRVTDDAGNKNPFDLGAAIAAVTRRFPTTAAPDYYSFIKKDKPPEIFFTQYDENSGTGHSYSATRPVFRTRATLLTALGGYVQDGYLEEVTVSFDRGEPLPAVKLLGAAGQGAYTPGTSTQFTWNLSNAALNWLPVEAGISYGLHTVIVTARDAAGNTTIAEWKFYKDNIGPVISFTNITEQESVPASPPPAGDLTIISGEQNAALAITGRFDDDYSAINSSSAICRFDGAATNYPAVITGSGTTVTWSVNIPASLADGKHYFRITVQDALTNATTKENLWFVLDRNNPILTPTSDMDVGGNLGTGFNPNVLKTDEYARVFSAASVTSTLPAGNNVIFTLSGTAKDTFLNDISVALRAGSSTNDPILTLKMKELPAYTGLPEWTSSDAGPFYSLDAEKRLTVTRDVNYQWKWTLNILSKDLDTLKTGLGNGVPCSISVNARDLAGFDSGMEHWRFYLDTVKPIIEFTNIAANGTTVFQGIADSSTNGITMSGMVTDDNRVKSIQYYLQKYNYATGNWEYRTTAATWSTVVPATLWSDMPASGDWGASPNWSLTGEQLNPAVYGPQSAAANIFTGTNGEGRYRICIQATDYSLAASNAGNLEQKLNENEFYVDRSDPLIAWNTNAQKAFYRNQSNGSIQLTFTASDPNYLWNTGDAGIPANSFAVEIKKTDTPTLTYSVPAGEITSGARTFNAGTGIYTQSITLNPRVNSGSDWPNGKYTLTLTVKDRAGKTASVNYTREFTVDNNAPEIEINGASATPGAVTTTVIPAAITGRNQLRGSFNKGSGSPSPVAFVAFYVAPGGVTAPSTGTSGGTTITYANLTTKDVDIDLSAGSAGRAALYNMGWRFYDVNDGARAVLTAPDSTRLMLIGDGLNQVNMTIPDTRNLITKNYAGADTYTHSGAAFNGVSIPSSDTANKLQIYFLAIDEAGNRNVKIYEYWIYPEGDRPTVTVSRPNENEPEERRLLNGRIRIGGNAKDNVRVKNVWFRIREFEADGVTLKPTPITANVDIPVWNVDTWQATNANQSPLPIDGNGSGWFMANGGGSKDVSWWANINTNGELDPPTEGSRKIAIEVLAEDAMYEEDGIDLIDGTGLYSKLKTVKATVVKDAPEWGEERVKSGSSGVSTTIGQIGPIDFTAWNLVQDVNLRKRAAYSITVTHETGISAINWTPPADLNGGNPINLLNTDLDYNKTIYSADLADVNAAAGTRGIAVKAGPKQMLTGNVNVPAGTYLIWKWNIALETAGLIPSGTGDMSLTTITVGTTGARNLGAAQLMPANAQGRFEWVVVADIHADIIDGGKYKYPGGTGVYSGISSLKLRATENSQSVPLSIDYEAALRIDNQPPEAAYTHNPYVAGAAANFGGEAGDSGEVNGIDKVVLWFSRANTPISWHDQQWNGTAWVHDRNFSGGGTVPDGVNDPAFNLTAGLTSVNMPVIPAENAAANSNYNCIVIKYNDPLAQNDKFGHKLPIGFATVGGKLSTAWYVTLDSTLIESGRITAHYIVYDKAGNASYYTQKLIVMNGVPRISRITLATDIRGDTGLTTTDFTANRNYGDSSRNADAAYSVGSSPITTIGTKTGGSTNAAKGISEEITINTDDVRDYGVVYDEPFNVRNNLLAFKVEVTQPLSGISGGKDRKFRVEYVSGARLISGVTDLRGAAGIRAGRIYIINDSGSRFPWGSFGVQVKQGEIPRKGAVFMAVENGIDLNIPPDVDYGTPSVWELNSDYYTGTTLNRTVPLGLQLNDVAYPSTSGGAKSAEFVYAGRSANSNANTTGAFDAVQFNADGTTGAYTKIHDFTPTPTADGRPAAYPALTANAYPWAAHSLFIIRVFGGNEDELFGDFALMSIRVNNFDRTQPYAQLYDLNPKTEGQENTQTLPQALSIPSIGGNRAKGGLYNTGTTAKVAKSGHIEPRRTTNLTSGQMGGAANAAQAVITKPFLAEADKATKLFDRDTVSGDVILRGYVEDDQRIAGVTLNINGADYPILQRSNGFALQVTAAAAGKVGWTETIDLNRHRVEWAYLWTTETIPGGNNVVANNITVRAIAYNANADVTGSNNPSPAVTLAGANAAYNYYNPDYAAAMPRYNQIGVNLRPYITGFRRNQAAHNTRSRQGWYMFARNEEVVVAGFNLANGNGNTNITVGGVAKNNIGSANTNALIESHAVTGDDFTRTTRFRVFMVGTATTGVTGDGVVTLTVNNYSAVNTPAAAANNETANPPSRRPMNGTRPYILPWNIEYSPGIDGSNLWDDFIQAHIWQSNNTDGTDGGRFAATNKTVILNPAMSIDPANGTLYESHNEGGSRGDYTDPETNNRVNRGNLRSSSYTQTAVQIPIMQCSDPIIMSDIYRSPDSIGGLSGGSWVVASHIGRSGAGQYWRAYGGIYLSGPGGTSAFFVGGEDDDGTNQSDKYNGSLYLAESAWYNSSTNSTTALTPAIPDQFMNPHIVTSYNAVGTQEHIHVSYYDRKDGSIKYRYNLRGAAGAIDGGNGNTAVIDRNNAAGIPKMWTNLDGGHDNEDIDTSIGYTLNRANNNTNINTAANRYVRTVYVTNGQQVNQNDDIYQFGSTTNTNMVTIKAPIAGTITGLLPVNTTNQIDNTAIVFTILPLGFSDGNRVVRYNNRGAAIDVGKHNSIAVTSQGYPVIAYYDATNQRLKLAVSRSAAPILAENWVIRDYVIPRGNKSSFGTGEFVSMKIDAANNRVHIAAMNTNKRLVYITGILNIPTAQVTGASGVQQDDTTPANNVLTNVTVQIVDSVGNVGKWCALSLDRSGNPWISYMDESYIGARDGAKAAYLNTTTFYKGVDNGSDNNSYFRNEYIDLYGESLAGWETMHVPTTYRVENPDTSGRENGRLGLECFPTRNVTAGNTKFWSAAVSYLSMDMGMDRYHIAYYVK